MQAVNQSAQATLHGQGPASPWVARWSHLLPPGASVLDIACGRGRHMKWFSDLGHQVTGMDRSPEALLEASAYGTVVLADIENSPWPLMQDQKPQQFQALVVTNYLWRSLFPVMAESVAPGGFLIYETFAVGNETVGKPSRPDFLLQRGELLASFPGLHTIAFEEGYLEDPPRFIQRIVAHRPHPISSSSQVPEIYRL
jgi:SAM-dependent methyltransferase